MLHIYSGEKLRELRARAQLTQRGVTCCTGISKSTLHYLEHGLQNPQTGTLQRLLTLYGRRISDLESRDRVFWNTT